MICKYPDGILRIIFCQTEGLAFEVCLNKSYGINQQDKVVRNVIMMKHTACYNDMSLTRPR